MTAEVESVLGAPPSRLAEPEVVVLRVRSHARRLIVPAVLLCAIAALAGFWVGRLPETWQNVFAGIAAIALAVVFGLLPLVFWLASRTTITTQRVLVTRGLFTRHRAEAQLSRVREVRTRRGPLQRLWGAGDIELLTGAESVRLPNLPGVVGIAAALRELMERNYEHTTRAQGFFAQP